MTETISPQQYQAVADAYQRALLKCARAKYSGKQYVGFRRYRGSYRLIATDDDCNGDSALRQPSVADWAINVVYRLREQGFLDVPAVAIDAYFTALHRTGYGQFAKKT